MTREQYDNKISELTQQIREEKCLSKQWLILNTIRKINIEQRELDLKRF